MVPAHSSIHRPFNVSSCNIPSLTNPKWMERDFLGKSRKGDCAARSTGRSYLFFIKPKEHPGCGALRITKIRHRKTLEK